ncbi:hypothetical protein B0A50_03796 [Salinomyces thailandicus]|uniref:SRP9 domain-containing protein n=1 Tax=Salinomyces thailandicus TaxID=706561 RepID=A0A4U0U4C1_9PEZI|nr:hypothetical protein B0A50_03796 [Salinomyces thailandica]
MVYLDTIEEWHRQSALLLQARPTTARITTKYKIPNLATPKYQKPRKRKREDGAEEKDAAAPKVPKAWLVLKTYDPASGVVLKFKTDRQADVGRLITGLGRLGRHMAALPAKAEAPIDTIMDDATTTMEASAGPAAKQSAPAETKQQQQTAGGGGGGGKKKKKGKK